MLVADALWLDDASIAAVRTFYDALPPHMMSEGVLKDAPFATMTVRDAFECDGVDESVDLSVTERGFNVFQYQVGDATENAFGSTALPFYGDLLMTVVRHETAHQFDRIIDADDELATIEAFYTNTADADLDWLRSLVVYQRAKATAIRPSSSGRVLLLTNSATFSPVVRFPIEITELLLPVPVAISTPIAKGPLVGTFELGPGSNHNRSRPLGISSKAMTCIDSSWMRISPVLTGGWVNSAMCRVSSFWSKN